MSATKPAALAVIPGGLDRYTALARRINGSEEDAIVARWEFGLHLVTERIAHGGKQLPNGRLDEICIAVGIKRRQVEWFMNFAERCHTEEEVRTAVRTFGCWTAIRDWLCGAAYRAAQLERMSKRRRGCTQTTRWRKVWCLDCGYTLRLSRMWMQKGLPLCPNPHCISHGQTMTCADPADAVELGLLDLNDLGRERTAVCRRNGWHDSIVRRSPGRRSAPRQCRQLGCSSFVRRGDLYCGVHAHHETPF
jgi:hypothetical protein